MIEYKSSESTIILRGHYTEHSLDLLGRWGIVSENYDDLLGGYHFLEVGGGASLMTQMVGILFLSGLCLILASNYMLVMYVCMYVCVKDSV